MRLLLDTHVALWSVRRHSRLSAKALETIEAADLVFFSAVSLVEIAIKYPLGGTSRDPIPVDARQALEEFRLAGFHELPLTAAHAEALDALPPLHRDPFDRMLIAQARTEPLRLLTADRQLAAYGPDVVLV